jgi:hypothetical protein
MSTYNVTQCDSCKKVKGTIVGFKTINLHIKTRVNSFSDPQDWIVKGGDYCCIKCLKAAMRRVMKEINTKGMVATKK